MPYLPVITGSFFTRFDATVVKKSLNLCATVDLSKTISLLMFRPMLLAEDLDLLEDPRSFRVFQSFFGWFFSSSSLFLKKLVLAFSISRCV